MYDAVATQASLTHKFTGKERDAESTEDYFNARHFASSLGRFMVPDPSGIGAAEPSIPQSWNLYAYVLNSPLIFVDPTGLDGCIPGVGTVTGEADKNGDNTEAGYGSGQLHPGSCLLPPNTHCEMSSSGECFIVGDKKGVCFNNGDCWNGKEWDAPKKPSKPDTSFNMALAAPPIVNDLAANNGGIHWTWWKTFFKEAVQPWKELRQGGCGNEFLNAFSNGGIVSAVTENLDGGPGTGPDDLIKQARTIAAAQYVVNQGLAVPLRSSIYRGILSGTETAAGSFVVADAYTRIGQGYYAEYKSLKAGGCH